MLKIVSAGFPLHEIYLDSADLIIYRHERGTRAHGAGLSLHYYLAKLYSTPYTYAKPSIDHSPQKADGCM